MKQNLFLDRSKYLMKCWIIFAGIWFCITMFQVILGFKRTGYAAISNNGHGATSLEMFVSAFCFVFFCTWWIVELWKTNYIRQDYFAFVRSKNKTKEMKQILYSMKISIWLIMIGLFLSIPAGFINQLNWIIVMLILTVKINYISKFHKLINIVINSEDRDVIQISKKK